MAAGRTTPTAVQRKTVPRWSPVRMVATGVGVIFLLIGALGFVPGVTRHYDGLRSAGLDPGARMLGAFQVSALNNLVHVLFGLAGLAMSRTVVGARMYLIGGGAIYLVIWLYGRSIGHFDPANLLPVKETGDWLHLGLGAGMILLGALTPRGRIRP